ncbi:MAG TPA: hypothetical protein VMU89_04640 [Thermomicrobiaceae bacterium]|nr:hypothetical protein [Thermomicrobiaceae bacterium]
MQTAEAITQPQFGGSADERRVAEEAFRTIAVMGHFFPRTAPIRVRLTALAEFFAARRSDRTQEEWRSELDRVLTNNSDVFGREETADGEVVFVTTADGRSPLGHAQTANAHTLARRFQEPIPVPDQPTTTLRRRRPSSAEEELIAALEAEEQAVAAAEAIAVVETFEPEPAEVIELVVEPASPAVPAVEIGLADIAAMDEDALAAVITEELRHDLSVASFGDLWMVEDKVPRLSRGDLRRIRDYLLERNQPLNDETLLQDVLGLRSTAEDYQLMRFALNFRLSREHREFEFVGTTDQRLWSTTGLPPIGTVKRKASEIGTDYRFVLEHPGVDMAAGETVVEHVLTFYEYQLGVLPYDATFQALMPAAMQPEQRAAALAFESPQTYETFFVELRYPTGNRGGYLAGFERFFAENLVPGALITIERSENNGRYLLEYLPISGQDRKLLHLDEKKGRYVFRPTTFYCATQENMLLTENRFPRFANTPPLEERVRRRPEEVLAAVFERVGEVEGAGATRRYMAILDDLLAASNVERPVNAELVRSVAQSPNSPQFSIDPDVEDVFYYQPPAE